MVLVGDADEVPDHAERERVGEPVDQIDGPGRGRSRLEPVEQHVGPPADRRLQRGDPLVGQRGADQPSEPGVLGRIHGQHVAGEGGTGQALGHHLAVTGHRGEHVLGQPWVAQRVTGRIVVEDDPGVVAVGQPDRLRPGTSTVPRRGA